MNPITNDTGYRNVISRIRQLESLKNPGYLAQQELKNLKTEATLYELCRYDFVRNQINNNQGFLSA